MSGEGQSRLYPHVSELVPHGAPMMALVDLIDWKPGWARAEAVLGPGHPLALRGPADACVCMELIAQAIAACMGMDAFREGQSVRSGMVIACRQFEVREEPIDPTERVQLEVRCLRRTEYASVFEGEARDQAGAPIGSGQFTLVHGEGPY
ncbi:MAG: hypothetical protein GC161_13025 [Planctomycetaceae bacterium]|nr:hypothetical protein [Planctomycetaceae bacterium]